MATTMATVIIENLPADALILIQGSLDSTRDLHSFISASPACLRVFLSARRQILTSVLKNAIAPAALPHALAVFQIPRIPPPAGTRGVSLTARAVATTPIIQPFLERYFAKQLPVEIPSDMGSIIDLIKFLALVNRFIDQYAIQATREMGLKLGSDEFPPVSTTERARMQRAFFRYELYCRVFITSCSGINITGQASFFFSKLRNWEAEEIVYAHSYIASLSGEVIDDLQEQIVQAALAAPGAKCPRETEPYSRPTEERHTRGIMTWGRLPDGTPAPVRRHPQPLTWDPPIAPAAQSRPFEFGSKANLGRYGLGVFGGQVLRWMKTYISAMASLGLAHLEDLVTGDDARRKCLIHAFYTLPFNMTHLHNFAYALDMVLVMVDSVQERPAEPNTTDDPSGESMGYRIIRSRAGLKQYPRVDVWIGENYFGYKPLREVGCIFWDAKRFLHAPEFKQVVEDRRHLAGNSDWARTLVERESLNERLSGLSLPHREMMRLAVQFGHEHQAQVWAQQLNNMEAAT